MAALKAFMKRYFPDATLVLTVFGVYLITLAPGIYGFDSAELATGVYTLGIVHPPGYPLYILLGRLFSLIPINDLAYRLNLMSAVWGALTIWLIYRSLLINFNHRLIAWSAAFLLAISNHFWQMSILAEVYTLHTMLLALSLLFIFLWQRTPKPIYLYLFAFTYGLSLCNHTTGLMFAPAYTWLIATSPHWDWKKWGRIPLMALFFCIGLLPYIYFPLRANAGPALNYVKDYYQIDLRTIQGVFWMVSGQAYKFFAFGYPLKELPAETFDFCSRLWRNFFGAGVILGLPGIVFWIKKSWRTAIGLLWIFFINSVFYINYRVVDKDTMFLPAFLIWSLFIAAGICWIEQFTREKNVFKYAERLTLPALLLLFIPGLLLNWGWVDMSDIKDPQRFAAEVFEIVPQDTLIVASWSPAVILEYYHVVENVRPDITILNRSRLDVAQYYHFWNEGLERELILDILTEKTAVLIREEMETRPVYSIDYDTDLASRFEYLPTGNYFRMEPKASGYISYP